MLERASFCFAGGQSGFNLTLMVSVRLDGKFPIGVIEGVPRTSHPFSLKPFIWNDNRTLDSSTIPGPRLARAL